MTERDGWTRRRILKATSAYRPACVIGAAAELELFTELRKRPADAETAAGLAGRVRLVGGDFNADELPRGADFAWISAILHMNSRDENRTLFARVARAPETGGTVAVRDGVMDPDRTSPLGGALFAVNMLVNTPGGGAYTFAEIAEDLAAAGFADPELRPAERAMDSLVLARLERRP